MNLAVEIIGWIGSILVLWAYTYLALGKTNPGSKFYIMTNLIGGLALAIFTLNKEAYPSAIVNLIWCILAIRSMIIK